MGLYTLVFESRAPITFDAKDDDAAVRASAILPDSFRMYEEERLVWFSGRRETRNEQRTKEK
jgi:hypothetical protein